jgi:large subunit ribosomal protein L17
MPGKKTKTMRHGVKLNHLGRTSAHRHALLSGLAVELINHKRIFTTLAKARALRGYVEPLITKSKTNTTHQRRVVFSYLNDKEAVNELFATVSPKVADRPGGYTRIIKLGARLGDAAETAMIELVDFNEVYTTEAAGAGKKKRTRRSGGAKKKAAEPAAEQKAVAAAPEASAPEEKAADDAAATESTDNPETAPEA